MKHVLGAFPFALQYLLPVFVVVASHEGGWVIAIPFWVWVTMGDLSFGLRTTNLDPSTPERELWAYNLLLWLWGPCWVGVSIYVFWQIHTSGHLSTGESIALTVLLGKVAGHTIATGPRADSSDGQVGARAGRGPDELDRVCALHNRACVHPSPACGHTDGPGLCCQGPIFLELFALGAVREPACDVARRMRPARSARSSRLASDQFVLALQSADRSLGRALRLDGRLVRCRAVSVAFARRRDHPARH